MSLLKDYRSGCLPSAPRPTVSGTVSESLVGVMSGAKEGSLDHQVVGEPETIEGGTNLQRQASRPPNQRVCLPLSTRPIKIYLSLTYAVQCAG